jgi:hypothetical protein
MNRVSRTRRTLTTCSVIALVVLVRPIFGWDFCSQSPRVLHPRAYCSPSGQYEVLVDPSDMYGRFGASYRLTREGREVWSGRYPFTLWEAAVSDDGVVAGYAYTRGWSGYSGGRDDAGHGDFHVVVINREGSLCLDDVTKREHGGYPNAPPKPAASGLFLDAENDRLVIRVADFNRCDEAWWVFRFSTSKRLGMFEPKKLMADSARVLYTLDARPIAGTPLTLAHWLRTEPGPDFQDGARFTLVDQDGKPVWSLDWPGDYHVPNDENAEIRLWKELHEHGGILRSDQRGQFDLWCARGAERVSFSVNRDAGGKWLVAERTSQPYVAPVKPEQHPIPIPEWRPHVLGRIMLCMAGHQPEPPRRDAQDLVSAPELPEVVRLGLEALPLESSRQQSYAQPGTSRRWVVSHEVVLLVDSSGKLIRRIARRADRKWLESAERASVAANGSIAVVARTPSLANDRYTVNVYTAEGEPARTIHLPVSIHWYFPKIAYDGKHLVLAQHEQIIAFDTTGEVVGWLAPLPAGQGDRDWTPFLARDGRELLLFDGGNTIYRFAMP